MKQRKVTYRLYPSDIQEKKLSDMLGVHQRLYNKALEQRVHVYEEDKKSLSFSNQCKSLTQWRALDPELEAVNAQSEQVTLKRVSLAFDGFFRRIKNGESSPGFPRFKSYKRFSGWGYKTHADGWRLFPGDNAKHGHVHLSGVGRVRIRGKARTPGTPKTAEILRKGRHWYLSVTMNCCPKREKGERGIGLDWGVENFATIVDTQGKVDTLKNPRFGRKMAPKIKKLHQDISRTKKGSRNRDKYIDKLSGYYRKLANQRKNFVHQKSNELVKSCGLIATETLNIKTMTVKGKGRKKGLNREILDTMPSTFLKLLKCKAEEAGLYWVEVPTRQVKPSQTCHWCGIQEKKTLSQRMHDCPCGAKCSRDENSVRVMLNWALLGKAQAG
jgi:putative transposase